MSRQYALGKTPLQVRIQRFVDWYSPDKYIPIHPKEYSTMWEKQPREMLRISKCFDLPIVPIGQGGADHA